MSPQSRYEAMIVSLAKLHAIEPGQMFGKPCVKVAGKAFAAFHQDNLVFKLSGSAHEAALKLKGALLWDPSGKGRPMKQWVAIPGNAKFDELSYAMAAYGYVSEDA